MSKSRDVSSKHWLRKTQRAFFIVATLVSSSAFAGPTYDQNAINKYLDSLRGFNPPPIHMIQKPVIPKTVDLPQDLASQFRALQKGAVSDDLAFRIYACRKCNTHMDVTLRAVYIDLDKVEEIRANKKFKQPDELIAYVLAHELSHYFYEHAVMNSKMKVSLHGNPSLIDPKAASLQAQAKGHAEVDAMAFALLLRCGLKIPSDFSAFAQGFRPAKELPNFRELQEEFELRLHSIDGFQKNR